MARPVTLYTLQWGDLPLEEVCRKAKAFGYDGVELGLPNHVDVRETDPAYYQGIKDLLKKYDLQLYAISTHLVGQAVCDKIDERHRAILPDYIWGDGDPEGVHQRAAEELIFHSITTGASNDIEQATKIARAMVTMYGMSDRFGMMCLATVENQYLDGRAGLICGEDTAGLIDKEVLDIINSSYDTAMKLLVENREILDHISDYLYEKETITGKEFMKIFREMKGLPQEEDSKAESLMPDDSADNSQQTIKPAETKETQEDANEQNADDAKTLTASEDMFEE